MAAGGDRKSSIFQTLGLTAVTTAFAHPLAYVKVLVQVGYEPLAPRPGKTLMGKDILYLPGFFDYASHIKNVDGWSGLYRGLAPRILHNIVNSTVTNSVNKNFQIQSPKEKSFSQIISDEEDDEPVSLKTPQEFVMETCQLSVGKAAGVILSYPFHLISIRTMVQFVGKETYYRHIFSSFVEIHQEEGILGFFKGLIPQLLGEMLSFWIFRTLSYVVERYFDSQFSRSVNTGLYIQGLSHYASSLATFPFYLVTNIMAINNTRLAAGNPPNMPAFTNWVDCWVFLKRENILRRGDSIIRRTAPMR